jgi:aspartate/methionine/tyrosine aminotransferase
MNVQRLLSERVLAVDASGIRRVSELAKTIPGAINLSIGQPEFPVPAGIKRAAIDAIEHDKNGYTPNPGLDALRTRLAQRLKDDVGWRVAAPGHEEVTGEAGLAVTAGTSAAILLACMALLNPGDEIIIPDPYFVIYPHIATMCHAKAVRCDTYPDFRMTAERVEPLITPRTKMVLLNSPGNPSGVVMSSAEVGALWALCRSRGIVLLSDEIYDEFTFSESRTELAAKDQRAGRGSGELVRWCPSPARVAGADEGVLLVRGFGKTYGVTGWRLGYAAGPRALIEQMVKLQQYTFVCAPTPLQWGVLSALDTDMSEVVARYERRRDLVVERLSRVTRVERPGGAYYAFFEVPRALGMSATEFCARCVEEKLLVIPGGVFSGRDTHVRLSFAAEDGALDRGLEILVKLMSKARNPGAGVGVGA